MKHRCAWEGEKQKCKNLYEVVQGHKIKYIDGSGREYIDIISFRNNRKKDIQTDKENKRKKTRQNITWRRHRKGETKQKLSEEEINKEE